MYDKDGDLLWNKSMKESEGTTFRKGLSVYTGAVVVGYDFSRNDEDDESSYVAFCEIKGHEQMYNFSKAVMVEAKKKTYREAVVKTVDVEDTKVSVLAEDGSEDAEWIECWVALDGIAVEAKTKRDMQAALASLKSGGESVKKVEQLARIAEINSATSDVTVLVDLTAVTDMLKKKLAAEGGGAPISPSMFLDAFGLDELKAAAITLDLDDARSSASVVLLHMDKPKGIIPSIFRGTSTEVPQLAFLPAGADQASVSRQSIGAIYDALLGSLQKLGPLSPMITMQLSQFEQQAGVNLKNDLFGSLDDMMAQAQSLRLSANGLPDVSEVTAIKLKDRARFQSALEALIAAVGNGFLVFDEVDVEGQKVRSLKLQAQAAEGQGPNASQFAYAVTDEYLLFNQGSFDNLRKIISRLKSKTTEGSFWDTPGTQDALNALPKGYTGMGVSHGAPILKTLAGLINQAQPMLGAAGKAAASRKGPKNAVPGTRGAAQESLSTGPSFDAKALPADEVFARYFGSGASASYSESDATFMKIIALPVEAK